MKEAEIWDLKTVTAADYACEVQLPKRVCQEIATGISSRRSFVDSYGIRDYIDLSAASLRANFKSRIE